MIFEKAHMQVRVLQHVHISLYGLCSEVETRTPHGDAAEREGGLAEYEYARGRSQESHHVNSIRYERCLVLLHSLLHSLCWLLSCPSLLFYPLLVVNAPFGRASGPIRLLFFPTLSRS